MDVDELDDDRPMAARCPQCGELPRWESLEDVLGERWLAVCRCGRMQVFLPDQPDLEPKEPLANFLLGHRPRAHGSTPAWIRLFLRSIEPPWTTRWRYSPELCPACANGVRFELQACPRPYWLATCSLCLACGRATSEYSQPWQNLHELAVGGSCWAPPCPAVQRLRHCVFRPFARAISQD